MTLQTWQRSPDAILRQIDAIMDELAVLRQAVQEIITVGKGAPDASSAETRAETRDVVDIELQAYLELHPTLRAQFPEQYVALQRGQLVDHDHDGLALSRRVHQRWPDKFVLIRKVEAQPDRELRMRSPRFVKETT